MVLTILRTAFLVYVRLLLCLQGLYLGFWAWSLWPVQEPATALWARLGLSLLFAAAGLLLRPVRAYAGLVRR
jgi:hypothetical protein